jgi:hypothetical protein
MSNYQRQVRFRASHPNYFRKYKAAGKAARMAALAAEAMAVQATMLRIQAEQSANVTLDHRPSSPLYTNLLLPFP